MNSLSMPHQMNSFTTVERVETSCGIHIGESGRGAGYRERKRGQVEAGNNGSRERRKKS